MHTRFWVILQKYKNGAVTVFNERAYVDSEEATVHYEQLSGQLGALPLSSLKAIELTECTISKTVLHKEA